MGQDDWGMSTQFTGEAEKKPMTGRIHVLREQQLCGSQTTMTESEAGINTSMLQTSQLELHCTGQEW